MEIFVLIGSFTVVCLLGLPVAYALGLAAILSALYSDIPLEAVMLKVAGGMSGFSLLAIPFFILTGAIMAVGGMAERLINLAKVFVGAIRGGMDRLFAPGPGAASWPAARTPVCRCQEVPRAELDEAIAHGAADLHSLKLWTRAGMGPCQARICGPVMSLLLAARGHEIARLAPVSVRFPVRPLPLGALCHPRNHREGEHDHEDVRVADQRLRD